MSKEIWESIKGYKGIYDVSSFGRVKKLERVLFDKRGRIRLTKMKILKSGKTKNGYMIVNLSKNGVPKSFNVHRLVAEAFIPNIENKPCVNHRNSERHDNSVSNLEWCTYSENTIHGFKYGNCSASMKGRFGSDNPLSKKVVQFDKSGNFINEFDGMAEAERETGVANNDICRVCKGKRPFAGGFIWKYK